MNSRRVLHQILSSVGRIPLVLYPPAGMGRSLRMLSLHCHVFHGNANIDERLNRTIGQVTPRPWLPFIMTNRRENWEGPNLQCVHGSRRIPRAPLSRCSKATFPWATNWAFFAAAASSTLVISAQFAPTSCRVRSAMFRTRISMVPASSVVRSMKTSQSSPDAGKKYAGILLRSWCWCSRVGQYWETKRRNQQSRTHPICHLIRRHPSLRVHEALIVCVNILGRQSEPPPVARPRQQLNQFLLCTVAVDYTSERDLRSGTNPRLTVVEEL